MRCPNWILMEHSSARFQKWFDLILAMIDGRQHTAKDLAAVLGTSVRNLYYVLSTFERLGFHVVHEGTSYHIDPKSPFLVRIAQAIDLTEDEAAFLHALLSRHGDDEPMAGVLKRKVERYYDLRRLADADLARRHYANIALLETAMARKQVVVLHDYSSPHSRSLTDRVVEPFLFLGNKADIRAYELKSKQNKTFKIARIGRVEPLDTPWFNEAAHREVFTDMFMFSGENRCHVKLRLSLLAHHLLLEEYPHSQRFMTRDDSNHWLFETDVVGYVGLSRFILGLYDEVEVLEDDGLRQFLDAKIRRMAGLHD